MFAKSITFSTLFSFLPAALADLPAVSPKALPAGCSSYPGYNADTSIAGPWQLKVVDSENKAIDGFGNSDYYSVSFNPSTDRKPSLRWGHISIPTRNDMAKRALECTNGTLHAYAPTDLTDAGEPTNVQWTPLVLSPYPYAAGLMWKTDGEPVKVFEHYIDGVKQDGVFIGGYDASTTWGFKWYPANLGSYNQDFYEIRLLGPNSADPTTGAPLKANETRGYLRIDA